MDDENIFTFDIKSISLKVSAPIPGYDEVTTLLLICESNHFQDMDPKTIVKATFNSFGMKGNNKEHSSKTANANSNCPLCHLPGHTAEDCSKYDDCPGCDKVQSKFWRGCPSGKFPEKKSTNNNHNNDFDKNAKKQDKSSSL
jgi:hypothetical protein